MWIRAEGAYSPVVDQALFERARAIIDARSRHYSDDELLAMLRALLEECGSLSGIVIDEHDEMPSSSAYRYRFGSLLRAYELIGYEPDRDYRYIEVNRALRDAHPKVVASVMAGIAAVGGRSERDSVSDLIRVNDEFTASVVIARCCTSATGSLRWRIRLDMGLVPDITIAVRMDETNAVPLDYYVLPSIDMNLTRLRLAQQNGLSLDAYRFDNLDFFFALAGRVYIEEAA